MNRLQLKSSKYNPNNVIGKTAKEIVLLDLIGIHLPASDFLVLGLKVCH